MGSATWIYHAVKNVVAPCLPTSDARQHFVFAVISGLTHSLDVHSASAKEFTFPVASQGAEGTHIISKVSASIVKSRRLTLGQQNVRLHLMYDIDGPRFYDSPDLVGKEVIAVSNEDDPPIIGTLVRYEYLGGGYIPIVKRHSDGTEFYSMGLLLPHHPELVDFLALHGGKRRFDVLRDMYWLWLHERAQIKALDAEVMDAKCKEAVQKAKAHGRLRLLTNLFSPGSRKYTPDWCPHGISAMSHCKKCGF